MHGGGKNVAITFSDITFDSGQFDRSHVENGVRTQKLWPVKVCRQKLPKSARQGWGGWFGPHVPSFFLLRIRCGEGWLVWPHVPSFFFTDGIGKETLSRGKVVAVVMRVGAAAVDGCGGDDYGSDAETSGGGG
jgi:hypothetical protein